MKELLLAAKKVAGRKAGECPDCGGSSWDCCIDDTDCDNIEHDNCRITERHYYPSGAFKGIKSCKGKLPCPTCSPLRRITETHYPKWERKIIKGREHLREPHCSENVCSICGISEIVGTNRHPTTFTVQSVRALLEDLGEWEGFYKWLWGKVQRDCDNGLTLFKPVLADILTTDSLIVQSATTFLEGLCGN